MKITDTITMHNADSLTIYPLYPDASFDLLFLDIPYYKVKSEDWDNQWKTPADFLHWIGEHAQHWQRLLKANGSLFVCASPQMVEGVRAVLRSRFNVLNTIRWYKRDGTFSRADVATYRTYCETWEALIFCEKLRGFVFETLRKYLVGELRKTGSNPAEIRRKLEYSSNLAHNWFAISGSEGAMACWILPLPEQYEQLRGLFPGYFCRDYEQLHTEYEHLRRYFTPTRQTFRDTWFYEQVESYTGKHPTEKPYKMLIDIIKTCTRPGALVGDFFMGSGTTAAACQALGRKFVGCDMSAHWCEYAARRIETPPLLELLQPTAPEMVQVDFLGE